MVTWKCQCWTARTTIRTAEQSRPDIVVVTLIVRVKSAARSTLIKLQAGPPGNYASSEGRGGSMTTVCSGNHDSIQKLS